MGNQLQHICISAPVSACKHLGLERLVVGSAGLGLECSGLGLGLSSLDYNTGGHTVIKRQEHLGTVDLHAHWEKLMTLTLWNPLDLLTSRVPKHKYKPFLFG